jgi:DNA recombination protein RmuC
LPFNSLPMNPFILNLPAQDLPLVLLIVSLLFCVGLMVVMGVKIRLGKQRLAQKENEISSCRLHMEEMQTKLTEMKVSAARLETQLLKERQYGAEKLALLEQAREELRLQFQTLAQQIFDEKSAAFSTQNSEKLSAVLLPFQEQINAFRRRIDDIHLNDSKERVSLKEEILHLRELNRRINEEAINLTRALKGDRKLQGNWGELVLERVLEQSGLRKGKEYESQGGFRDQDNQLLKPDVIIHLPDGKDIIVDSKVSLSAWERFVNCDEEGDRQAYLTRHVQAVREHIVSLSRKDYAGLKGVRSLDFVLMFMPIEAAFLTAFQHDESLFSDAFTHKIIVVTPTTLLATLRTIENLWRFEHQSRNSQEIADQAGALYNKLCSFVDDMERIGKQLATCTSTFDAAMNKLTHGRGNIIALAHAFPELGVKVRKSLPRSITEGSELDLKN